jgi:ATP dependent DNA ligase domain
MTHGPVAHLDFGVWPALHRRAIRLQRDQTGRRRRQSARPQSRWSHHPAVNGVRMVGPWGQSCPIRGWAGLYSGPLCLFCFSSSLACRHLPIARRPAPAGCTKSSTTAAGRWPRRGPVGIRLITRRGNDWSDRFPLVVEALNHLKVRSRLIDGEVVCCDERGLAWFDVLRVRRNEIDAFLYAFDLLELDGADLRREPLEVRTATLASILRRSRQGGRLNEHLEHDCGLTFFQHPCRSAVRASCPSASPRAIDQAGRPTGSSSRTWQRQPCNARGKKMGAVDRVDKRLPPHDRQTSAAIDVSPS